MPKTCPIDPCLFKSPVCEVSGTELAVIQDIARRQQHGLKKYGVTVADNPLTEEQWLQHAYEEALDLAVYLRRLIDLKRAVVQQITDSETANEGV